MNGIATFSGVGISCTAGAVYTLTFTSTGLTSASQGITPTFGTATALVLKTPASKASNGKPFGIQPVGTIMDGFGNIVGNSSATVSLTISAGGVRVGVSDANNNGVLDLITGTGPGWGPHVRAFSFYQLDHLFEFYSDPMDNIGGVFVS